MNKQSQTTNTSSGVEQEELLKILVLAVRKLAEDSGNTEVISILDSK